MKTQISLLLILVIVVVFSACTEAGGGATPQSLYVVRVEDTATNKGIYNAKVLIEVGIGKISDFTDSDGYVRLSIPANYVDEPGRLVVEMEGYKSYRSEINLYVNRPATRAPLERVDTTSPIAPPLASDAIPIGTANLPIATSAATLTFTPVPDTPTSTPSQTPTWTPMETPSPTAEGAQMALVPAGEFMMGAANGSPSAFDNEKPPHQVYLDDFYIDLYEVTNALYAACEKAGSCTPPQSLKSSLHVSYHGNPVYDNYPVISVSWNQASAYCTWRGARLPTEAEWEKAARGTDGRIYPWGDNAPTCDLANYTQNSGVPCVGDAQAVGSYLAGANGLFDMAGNVWEWVQDWYNETYYGSQPDWNNPLGPAFGQQRVLRGGAWSSNSRLVRSTHRYPVIPGYGVYHFGFRCARTP